MSDSPRARTLLHLRRMLIAVAATSAVVGVDAEANEGDAGPGADAGDGDAGPRPIDPRTCDEGPLDIDAGPRPPKPDYCYAVVDPIPTPARGCGCHREPDTARAAPRGRRE